MHSSTFKMQQLLTRSYTYPYDLQTCINCGDNGTVGLWAVVVALSLETCWFAGVPVLGAMSITREESNREFKEK